jgi:hypothetical protein
VYEVVDAAKALHGEFDRLYGDGELTEAEAQELQEAAVAAGIDIVFEVTAGKVVKGIKIASVAGDFSVSVAKKLGLDKVLADLNRKFDGIGNAPNRTLNPIDNPVDLVGFRRDHIMNRHAPGSGVSGKTEFPSNWDEQRILHNISDVATDPNSRRVTSSHGTQVYGVRDGVEIRVDLYPDNHPRYAGQISTGFPVAGPNVPVNP